MLCPTFLYIQSLKSILSVETISYLVKKMTIDSEQKKVYIFTMYILKANVHCKYTQSVFSTLLKLFDWWVNVVKVPTFILLTEFMDNVGHYFSRMVRSLDLLNNSSKLEWFASCFPGHVSFCWFHCHLIYDCIQFINWSGKETSSLSILNKWILITNFKVNLTLFKTDGYSYARKDGRYSWRHGKAPSNTVGIMKLDVLL